MKIKKVIFITTCILINMNLYNAFSSDNGKNLVQLKISFYSSEPVQIEKKYFDRYSVLQYFTIDKKNSFIITHNLKFYGDITEQLLDSAGKLQEDVFVHHIYKNDEYKAASIKQMLFSILRNVQAAVQSMLLENKDKNSENYEEIQNFYDLLIGDVANIIFTSDYIKDNVAKYYNDKYVRDF